jgi:uncharacterized damage-inducible protein DinB
MPKEVSMMTKQAALARWDHLRMLNGIALRAVAALPADRLDTRPIPKMRTPKELVVHAYGMVVRNMIEGITSGEVRALDEPGTCAGIKTRDALLAYATECWKAADRAMASATDAQLARMAKTPFGRDYAGWMLLGITEDEFLHHRGQLYAYLRASGVEPPFMWDFANNAPEYRPKEHQQA